MSKRFFECDDNGCDYLIVATDMDHAKQIMRDARVEFGDPGVPLDQAVGLAWRELPIERADRIRCDVSDSDDPMASRVRVPLRIGLIPLSDCEIGEWFCSEW